MIIKIPSKSLLFGEYGVLYGLSGIVINSWIFHCEFDFQIVKNSDFIGIYSDYFGDNVIFLNKEKIINIANCLNSKTYNKDFLHTITNDKDELFFTCILIPYANFLKRCHFNLHINKYFDKSFGFGSSSAIIASVNLFFQKIFQLSETETWANIRYTIKLFQGKGSCYDIATQLYNAAIDSEPDNVQKIWEFKNTFPVPYLSQLNIHGNFGYILKTGVYSDTNNTLKNFNLNHKDNFNFAKESSALSEQFINNPNNVESLIKKSFLLQQQNNLTTKNIDKKFENLVFKYLGSGKGDTIWTTTSKLKKIQNQHVLYKIIL